MENPGDYLILNVDDDDIQRYSVTQLLKESGYRVIEASNGKETLEKVKQNPDLIILDVNLPDIDGFELCRRIRKIPGFEYVPIIHLSATYTDDDSVINGLENGADGYLIHPVEPRILLAYINAMLRIRELELNLLGANEDWYETFNTLNSGIIITEGSGIIKKANKRMHEILNISEKLCGKNIKDIFILWGIPEVLDNFEGLINKDEDNQIDFKLHGRFYNLISNILKDKDGNVKKRIFVIIDITAYKEMEEQYRQAQKMEAIGRLTGGVAHDFNNMLTAIIGYSEFLLMHFKEGDPTRQIVEEIKKAGQRAAELTQKLLAFSRKQTINPETVNLNDIVKDMEKMLKRLIGEDIKLVTELDENLGLIMIDPTQVTQVIMNIVVNAKDAMPNGGVLTIETRNVIFNTEYASKHLDTKIEKGEYVMLAISDTGVGMDEETKSHIFEPFFTTKGPGKGTGLGLSTVYGIIKQHKGYIWVYSQPGKGTTFKIYFPMLKKTEGIKIKNEATVKENIRGKETVLLVEDEDLVREMISNTLTDLGYNILPAANPREAMRILDERDNSIDIVVTDVVLPEMNGNELVRIIKEKLPSVKVLYVSGYTDKGIVSGGVLKKGINYLQKPFTPVSLAKKIRQILDRAEG